MLNKQIVLGRLTADPELRTTSQGVLVCSFSVASDDDVVRKDGTRDTDFVDCVAWQNQADFIARFMKKGRMIVVEGRPKTKRYTDQNGVSHKTFELRVGNVYFADSKRSNDNEQTTAPSFVNQIAPGTFADVDEHSNFADITADDDLPFI